MNLLVVCVTIAVLSFSASAHTQASVLRAVIHPRAVDPSSADLADLAAAAVAGRLKEAQEIFSALERRWHSFSSIEQSFLRGVAKVNLGRFTEARDLLRDVAGHYPALDDYAWFFLGEAALGAGDSGLASDAFGNVVSGYPHSKWYTSARERLVTVAMSQGKWDKAGALLEELRKLRPRGSPDLYIQLKVADLAVRRGDESAARNIYIALYSKADTQIEIDAVREGFDLFKKRFSNDPISRLSADDHLDLARIFLGRDPAEEAVLLLERIPSAARQSDFAELLGRAYYKARRYAEAYKQLCSLADHGGFSMDRVVLLRLCATAAARAGAADEAIKRNHQIMDEFPGTTFGSTALYKLAFLLMDGGKYLAAIDGYRAWLGYQNQPHSGVEGGVVGQTGSSGARQTNDASNKRAEGASELAPRALPVEGATRAPVIDAMWAIVWCRYRLGEWDAALSALSELDALVGSRGDWPARIGYWRTRIIEASGKKKEAHAAYAALAGEYGDSYYGQLARARARGSGVPSTFVQGERATAKGNRAPVQFRSAKAQALSRLGLWQYAFEEEDFSGAGEGLYRAVVDRLGERWGIDPSMVHALIRQESQYRAAAVSPAGAVGLMQLMPATAARLARELHWRDFSSADLYRPVTNVRLGMWYLRGLLLKFDGRLPLVLAGYNAGEEAVDRWVGLYWQRRGGHATTSAAGGHAHGEFEIDEFVEEIPYRETLNYVRKVLRYYAGS